MPKRANIQEPAILFTVSRLFREGMTDAELYEITRKSWVLSETRKDNAQYAFTVYQGIIRQVFKIDRWYPVTTTNPDQSIRERWAFEGRIAKELQHYIGMSTDNYPGTQNPVRYVYC